jgi:hypothetical protein
LSRDCTLKMQADTPNRRLLHEKVLMRRCV